MAQPSLTRYYQTRRQGNCAQLKEAKTLGFAEEPKKNPVTSSEQRAEKEARKIRDAVLEPAKAHAPKATIRKTPAARRGVSKANIKASEKSDIRNFLAKPTVKGTDSTPSASRNAGDYPAAPAKRPSSPSVAAEILNTPKRVRRSLNLASDEEVSSPDPPTNAEPSVINAPKKMKNLGDLKARMAALKEKTNALEHRRSLLPELSPDCKASNTVAFEVPASPRGFAATLSPSPRKKPTPALVKTPAHERFKHLLDDAPVVQMAEPKPSTPVKIPRDVHLGLPVAYKTVLESFRALDVIYFVLYNRKDVPIYLSKIQAKVRELSGKTFNELTLGRIKAAFPDAYEFSMEEVEVLGMGGKKKEYHLVLRPKFGLENMGPDTSSRVAPPVLRERLAAMEAKLLDLAHQKHEDFLASLSPPVTVERGSVRRWHPEFVVDAVPGIDAAPLPQKPAAVRPATARDILNSAARNLFDTCPRMVAALEKASAASKPAETEDPAKPREAAQSASKEMRVAQKPIPKDLMKFNSKLLEKIRAREAEKNLRVMVRSETEEKRLNKLKRLPDLAKLLHGIFVSEKKSVLPLDSIVERLSYSYSGALSQRQIREHVEMMAEEMKGAKIPNSVAGIIPEDWIRIVASSENSTFVRLYKQADVNLVVNTLQGKIQAAT